ncbi:MAG: DivIVA domain-containing protein [Actinomycetaceae bacterium]|nr:DivIVA domain-containing protein [Actinomycetaceae bacterium]MDY5853934.1 DivIVA domain-containing protein [Arcanobacterium sp.]
MAMLTEHDVVNMRFKEPLRVEDGYDQDEVDDFLDLVAETIAQLTKDKADLEAQLQTAQTRAKELENAAAQAPVPAQPQQEAAADVNTEAANATSMLALAQKLHDEYVSNGKAESERMISEAESERTRIVNETNAERDRILKETEDNKNAVLTKLDEDRTVLERKISELRDFERDYRGRLKSYLESLLQNVNNSDAQA